MTIRQLSKSQVEKQAVQVTIRLHGALRRYRPEAAEGATNQFFSLSLPAGATIIDLAHQLRLVDGLINAAAVNGEAVAITAELHDGDEVRLFPPAAGG